MQEVPNFTTIKKFSEDNPAFTYGSLRSAIFWKRKELEEAGAIVRYGRRVLINETAFLRFVQEGGLKTVRGGG